MYQRTRLGTGEVLVSHDGWDGAWTISLLRFKHSRNWLELGGLIHFSRESHELLVTVWLPLWTVTTRLQRNPNFRLSSTTFDQVNNEP